MNKIISSAIAVSAITVSTVFGLTLVNVLPAQAEADGCTGVPDFKFTDACNSHDTCYSYSEAPKASCDKVFLKDMQNTCNTLFTPNTLKHKGCLKLANTYYRFVVVSNESQRRFDKARNESGRPSGK
ncbi:MULTISPECIES: phospholipase A2 [unclassified Dolichospermum]|uniref:phospholipase A2 n=1 Tax=unclassified Dolichospermum TaxID=2622029 RepID=UPI001444C6FB|nr:MULTISPECIES: phospholipase A2 [unclassified Dolichospermum]MTJ18937.1 hypothetical protein [Dolichospermum sp. UHCC 0299]MTJ38576.1 hypothetical protein [Dolichospermum sp. UHCC 0406]